MPLNVRRFCTSVLLVFTFSIFALAQTSADVMRERVAKAKAYIAVKNYNAAIYELENIRRESNDPTVGSVINVLLMNSYLEQGDYKRAQEFLKELAAPQKSGKQTASANYFAAAGQVVKGARNQLERYKSLGLSVSDRNLPLEALTDVEKMRETLEIVVEQSKTFGKDKSHSSNAMALLEEATNARGSLARDDFDAKRWKDEIADAREMLASSRSVIVNAVDGSTTSAATATNANTVASNTQSGANKPAETVQPRSAANTESSTAVSEKQTNQIETLKPVSETTAKNDETKKSDSTANAETKTAENKTSGSNQPPAGRSRRVENQTSENRSETVNETAAQTATGDPATPVFVGSLVEYATQRTNPVYPTAAKNMRMTGVVKVELVVDEKGQVAEVQKTSGPSLLQRAASDAVKKWKFKPFTRDGQPAKATGFVNFNFSL